MTQGIADRLRDHAVASFHQAERVRYLDKPLWVTSGATQAKFNGEQHFFRLITDRNSIFIGSVRSRLGETLYKYALINELSSETLRRRIGHQTIALVANHDFGNPYALILPSDAEGQSSSLVVGDEVNNAMHLQEVASIVEEIYDRSLPQITEGVGV